MLLRWINLDANSDLLSSKSGEQNLWFVCGGLRSPALIDNYIMDNGYANIYNSIFVIITKTVYESQVMSSHRLNASSLNDIQIHGQISLSLSLLFLWYGHTIYLSLLTLSRNSINNLLSSIISQSCSIYRWQLHNYLQMINSCLLALTFLTSYTIILLGSRATTPMSCTCNLIKPLTPPLFLNIH